MEREAARQAACMARAGKELAAFVRDLQQHTQQSPLFQQVQQAFERGTPLAEVLESQLGGLFEGIILPRRREPLLYAARNCTRWAYGGKQTGRRSFRTADPRAHAPAVMEWLRFLVNQDGVDKGGVDMLCGRLTEEERAYVIGYDAGLQPWEIAWEIDRGNAAFVEAVADILRGESERDVDLSVIRGVLMSRHAGLHELLGKLLLAARLQEGLRQVICELADTGSLEGFRAILRVIHDNGLIRFSSVKRALGVWTGLLADASEVRSRDLERLSDKTEELACALLDSPSLREEALASEDSMKLHLALWASGVHEAADALAQLRRLSLSGSQHQRLTAGFSLRAFGELKQAHRVAGSVLRRHREPELLALYLSSFMPEVSMSIHEANRRSGRQQGRVGCRVAEYFEDAAEAREFYGILMEIRAGLKGKVQKFSPCVFPWHSAELSRHEVARRLIWLASALGDEALTDATLDCLEELEYGRDDCIQLLLSQPRTATQRRRLVVCMADKQADARNKAFALLEHRELEPEHYLLLEDMLRYKNAEMRANIIALLMKQGDEALLASVSRLLADKKEEKRTAGLDMVLQLGNREGAQALYERCRALVAAASFESSKEQILAEQIVPAAAVEEEGEAEALYSEADTYTPQLDKAWLSRAETVFNHYFYRQRTLDRLRGKTNDFELINEKLAALMDAHMQDEFPCYDGEMVTLADGYHLHCHRRSDGEPEIPLAEVWDAFYEAEIGSPVLVLRALTALLSEGSFDEYARQCAGGVKKLLGEPFTHACSVPNIRAMAEVYQYYLDKHGKREELQLVAAWVAWQLSQQAHLDIEHPYVNSYGQRRRGRLCVTHCYQFTQLLEPLGSGLEQDVAHFFPLCCLLARTPGYGVKQPGGYEGRDEAFSVYPARYRQQTIDVIRAAHAGVVGEGYMYRCLMEGLEDKSGDGGVLWYLSGLARGEDGAASRRSPLRREPELYDYALAVYEKLMTAVLHEELSRGDTETRYSRHVARIRCIRGARYYVRILAALGREPLRRTNRESWKELSSKRDCLSHLLSVCVPAEGEGAEGLAALLRGTDVREERLVEAALYAPAWLPITEKLLGWPGFESACYYFMAHTSAEMDDKLAARVARYTHLSREELANGAFDVAWFHAAHEALGEERFSLVYKAAKYVSDGARHTRARKYADAATGKLEPAATQAAVAAKRDKELLMAYTLIPLSGEEDAFARYLYLQQFAQESQSRGAQRRASEAMAVGVAMKNLATNAGYVDATRLAMRMETRLLETMRPLMEETPLDDVVLCLRISAEGRADIVCTKGGKVLKAVPARLKKEPHVQQLMEAKRELNGQYARTRHMLECSMVEGEEYRFAELQTLLHNPVAAPLLRDLVWVQGGRSGYLEEGGLRSAGGERYALDSDSTLRVAHPYDLYGEGSWHAWQQELFARGTVQPFRQVFRELYLPTAEEAGTRQTRRYAGHQVQPQKALACLKARGWQADYEDGLQKVCYQSNIVVRLCALADWFTPSDIEAPTLEEVEFCDRRSGCPLTVGEVPPLLFSEAMRDVDMAVSVAHAGGVDPEASHSTVEMRAALLHFTLPLFKIQNVEIVGSHAHIAGSRAAYTLHLGSGIVHQKGGTMLSILPVHSQHRGRLFLPFADDDPRTAEILSKVLLLAEDAKLQDPTILAQIRQQR